MGNRYEYCFICVCGVNFSLMMSDGRKIRLNDMKIVDEHCSKIKRINSKVILGFTGDPIPTMNAIKELENYNVELLTLERVKRIIINYIKSQSINNLGIKLLFSGRNKSNKFVSYVIDSSSNFQETAYIFDTGFAVNYALPHDCESNVNQICDKHIINTMPWNSIEELKMHMKECINEVSTLCYSVNNNTFEEIII